jgi:hypothetical protein
MALMASAREILEFLGDIQDAYISPVFPVKGGAEIWSFRLKKHEEKKIFVPERLKGAETGYALRYDEPQAFDIICKRPSSDRRKKFSLDGHLNALDHAVMLTALGGISGGANLRDFGFSFSGPGHYSLCELHRRNPSLTDVLTHQPLLGNTMSPFLEVARKMVRAETGRQAFFAG